MEPVLPAPMLTNRMYDWAKKFVTIIIPALSTLYFTLANVLGLPYAEEVVGTMAALATFGGVVLGLSTKAYNNSDARFDGDVVVAQTPEGTTRMSLELNDDVQVLRNQDTLLFKVIGPEVIE